jgi:para-aminobenzoate synthetase component I
VRHCGLPNPRGSAYGSEDGGFEEASPDRGDPDPDENERHDDRDGVRRVASLLWRAPAHDAEWDLGGGSREEHHEEVPDESPPDASCQPSRDQDHEADQNLQVQEPGKGRCAGTHAPVVGATGDPSEDRVSEGDHRREEHEVAETGMKVQEACDHEDGELRGAVPGAAKGAGSGPAYQDRLTGRVAKGGTGGGPAGSAPAMQSFPIRRIALSDDLTPDAALAALAGLPGRVLLESASGGGRSLVSAEPREVFRWQQSEEAPDPFEALRGILAAGGRAPGGSGRDRVFAGGWIGYLGYEVADALERLPPPPAPSERELPTIWMGAYDWAVVWPAGGGVPALEGACFPGDDPLEHRRRLEALRVRLGAASEAGNADDRYELAGASGGARGGAVAAGAPMSQSAIGRTGLLPPGVSSSLGQAGFEAGVEAIREYIRAGDLFQANLTHRLSAQWPGTGEELYRALRARSPGPFSAYLETESGQVASISPEAFLTLRGRRVVTRPIKGTAPRSADPDQDLAAAEELTASAKDRAENVMIVDLLRNDLSRVCRPGSVHVPELLALESHPTVHHLVSTVEGELEEGCGPVDLLRATLPGGSITGAPKIRAMEVLRELEPVRRGVYTGALGVIERSGAMELSIAIRTATLSGGEMHYGAGGGITLDSDARSEWLETLDKARPFLQAATGEMP